MSALRRLLDRAAPHFGKGGRLERWHTVYEAADTFLYTPPDVTRTGAHVRDALDLKRMMTLVVIALLPCVFMAMYNTGLQANLAIDPSRAAALEGWRHDLIRGLGIGYAPDSVAACLFHGALYFLPLYAVTMAVGGAW
jgi:Na+-transporting NADH:ubiquinone oxidoreductase subunit B